MAPPDQQLDELVVKFIFIIIKMGTSEFYYYCVDNTGFSANPEDEGTYSKYASFDDQLMIHYFLGIKFGLENNFDSQK